MSTAIAVNDHSSPHPSILLLVISVRHTSEACRWLVDCHTTLGDLDHLVRLDIDCQRHTAAFHVAAIIAHGHAAQSPVSCAFRSH